VEIIIYVKNGCRFCEKMEDFIMSSGTTEKFSVMCVDENDKTLVDTILDATGMRVMAYPITLIKKIKKEVLYKKYIVGYSPEEYMKAINGLE